MRSLARAFSSSRRAPPKTASKRCSTIASSSGWVCSGLRVPSVRSREPAVVDVVLHPGDLETGAETGDGAVAVVEHLGEVVPRVDVQQR